MGYLPLPELKSTKTAPVAKPPFEFTVVNRLSQTVSSESVTTVENRPAHRELNLDQDHRNVMIEQAVTSLRSLSKERFDQAMDAIGALFWEQLREEEGTDRVPLDYGDIEDEELITITTDTLQQLNGRES